MRRALPILLLVLTAAVIVSSGYVVAHHDPVPSAGRTPGYSAPPAAGTRTAAASASSGASGPQSLSPGASLSPAGGQLRTVFLGDNYTAGAGASRGKSWVDLASRRLGLTDAVVAVRGGGYAKRGGPDQLSYDDLVDQVAAADPQLIVVSGGRNDVDDQTRALDTAAAGLFQALRSKLPDAVIVAIAPWWGDSQHPAGLQAVDGAVRDGVAAAGGTYLDLADPLVGHPNWMADEVNPNNRGHAAIARSVESALRTYLPASG